MRCFSSRLPIFKGEKSREGAATSEEIEPMMIVGFLVQDWNLVVEL